MSISERAALAAFIVVASVVPASLAAQATNQATPPVTSTPAPTPTPTPTPAPAGDSVGPPQLRDFNLNGTVTRPAPEATPTPLPRDAVPRTPPSVPRETVPAGTAPPPRVPNVVVSNEPAPSTETDAVAPQPSAAIPPLDAPPIAVPEPIDPAPVAEAAPAADSASVAWWPWLAALLAASLGGAFLYWRRRQRGDDLHGADDTALGALVAAPAASPAPFPRAMPTPPRPAPHPAPPPPPTPAPPPPPMAPRPDGIFASRLKPELGFELEPIRAETDAGEGAALTFDLIVINRGGAPARDVLIEAQLINAGPQVDAAVGRFFTQPAGAGQRVSMIAPMGRVSLRTQLTVAASDLAPLMVEGRKLFVPVVAINAHYRSNGAELTESSSFLVGRSATEGAKMAPFRLDRGAGSWSGLAARLHSNGLER